MKKRVARPLLVASAGLAMLSMGCKQMATGNLLPSCVMDGGVCVPYDGLPQPPPKPAPAPPKPAEVDGGS